MPDDLIERGLKRGLIRGGVVAGRAPGLGFAAVDRHLVEHRDGAGDVANADDEDLDPGGDCVGDRHFRAHLLRRIGRGPRSRSPCTRRRNSVRRPSRAGCTSGSCPSATSGRRSRLVSAARVGVFVAGPVRAMAAVIATGVVGKTRERLTPGNTSHASGSEPSAKNFRPQFTVACVRRHHLRDRDGHLRPLGGRATSAAAALVVVVVVHRAGPVLDEQDVRRNHLQRAVHLAAIGVHAGRGRRQKPTAVRQGCT